MWKMMIDSMTHALRNYSRKMLTGVSPERIPHIDSMIQEWEFPIHSSTGAKQFYGGNFRAHDPFHH